MGKKNLAGFEHTVLCEIGDFGECTTRQISLTTKKIEREKRPQSQRGSRQVRKITQGNQSRRKGVWKKSLKKKRGGRSSLRQTPTKKCY